MIKIKRLLKAFLKTMAVTAVMILSGAIGAGCASSTVFLEWTIAIVITVGFVGMVAFFYFEPGGSR